ncbi:MAG: 30S ribosomal protein S20 [Nitrospinota bacterium]|nr:30S ribosomal protein S20 [Nitrospinota bacterium]
MANHKSAIKRNRQTQKKSAKNNSYRTLLKSTTKKVRAEVENKDKKRAEETLRQATSIISQIASKGVIHKRTASRKISNLSKLVHGLSSTG